MEQNKVSIQQCDSSEDFLLAKELIMEYTRWLGFDLAFQNFDQEIDNLREMYNKRDGGLLLAMMNGLAVGVAGVRRFNKTDCEIKRMFVKDGNRGKGIGQLLLTKCIELARAVGYDNIKLDTTDLMKPAIKLYSQNGFVEISPYRYNPHEAARYFELKLHQN